ncbi:MAG TPA: DMT family transporter [Rubrobacteraceae bacterium]|nr:DMT family transporter [Rubrobacteraceae bacterium]
MRIFGKRRFGVLAFVLLVVFWSSAFSVVKIGLDYSPPLLFAGLRTMIGGIVITVAAALWGGKPHFRRDWWIFLLLAAFNVALFIGGQTFAVLNLSSGTAAVLIYLQPILVGFLAWMILGESLTPMKVVGLLLGFAGIVAVSSGGLTEGGITPVGVAFGVASALFWALGTVFFKKYEARVSTLWAVAVPFLIGGVALMAVGILIEPLSGITWNGAFEASLLYSALIGTGFAWLLFFGLVRAGEASRVASYIFVVPLAAVAIGAVFLGEGVGPSLLVGAGLVVAGIYLVNRRPIAGGPVNPR